MERPSVKRQYLLNSVNNTLKILDLLSVRDSLGVAEISRLLKLDKTSVFKMLYTLEHRDYVIKTADWIVDLGPEGGNGGGEIIAKGTPEQVAEMTHSHTARFLKPILDKQK